MNIIICGLKGTGKTTLSKLISENFNYSYINDYKICSNNINEEQIINFINNNDNFVIDLCYSLKPNSCTKLKNVICYFLGFVTVNETLLFNLLKNKGKNITKTEVKNNIAKCKQMQEECKINNIPFYDINKDRQIILNEILTDLKLKLNK